jgi:hypothetical protein
MLFAIKKYHMSKNLLKIILLLTLSVPSLGIAGKDTLRVICTLSHTIDQNGESSSTSGEYLVTITASESSEITIKKSDSDVLFNGKVTEEEIYGETRYKLQNSSIFETILINRYTGVLTSTFQAEGKKGGLIHYGKCRPAKEKLF